MDELTTWRVTIDRSGKSISTECFALTAVLTTSPALLAEFKEAMKPFGRVVATSFSSDE